MGMSPLPRPSASFSNFMREIPDFIVPVAKRQLTDRPPLNQNFLASPFKDFLGIRLTAAVKISSNKCAHLSLKWWALECSMLDESECSRI